MKKIRKVMLAVLAAVALTFASTEANAALINGALTISGGAAFDTASLATATQVDSFHNVSVQSADGDFASFVSTGDSVTMAAPYVFSPSTPTLSLYSVGGFTFDLANSVVEFQNANYLLISGSGTITGNGFEATPGTWSFSTQSPSADGIFSFSAASNAAAGVPESGATVVLLGISLIGVAVVRRKFSVA